MTPIPEDIRAKVNQIVSDYGDDPKGLLFGAICGLILFRTPCYRGTGTGGMPGGDTNPCAGLYRHERRRV